MTPDWSKQGTLSELEQYVGFKLQVGWTITTTDTVLVWEITNGVFCLMCWNTPKAREQLERLLSLPIHRL